LSQIRLWCFPVKREQLLFSLHRYNPRAGAQPMSIKSDKWIRRMAREHGMIEPFEPG